MAKSNLEEVPKNKSHLFTLSAIAAFGLLVVWFTLQNSGTVRFQFALWGWDVSLALLLFTCVFIGILLACIAVLPAFLAERRFRKRAEKQISDLSFERDELRRIVQSASAPSTSSTSGSSTKVDPHRPL